MADEEVSAPPPSSLLDPFALLGVTIDSTPEEAKAGFRNLALIAHPDKGGRAEDMKALLVAYRFVAEQLGAVNRTTTVEDREAEFAAFCKAQADANVDAGVASLRELLVAVGAEADGEERFLYEFNRQFESVENGNEPEHENEPEQTEEGRKEAGASMSSLNEQFARLRPTAIERGYGAAMAASEYAVPPPREVPHAVPRYEAIAVDAVDAVDAGSATPGKWKRQGKEPDTYRPFATPRQQLRPDTSAMVVAHSSALIMGRTRGCGGGQFSLASCATDYSEAHNSTPEDLAPPPTEAELAVSLEDRFDALIASRKAAFYGF